jgi:hypothetical protein
MRGSLSNLNDKLKLIGHPRIEDHMRRLAVITLLLAFVCTASAQTSESVAQRNQRMRWWREARFGMFIHWPYAVLPVSAKNVRIVTGAAHMEWAIRA